MHFASSRRLNQYRYALVLPCPDSTAVSFGVRLIIIPILSITVGKYCFVASALGDFVHCSCHFWMASSAASWYMALLGFLLNP